MHWIYFLLAILAGTMMPTQAAVNHKLATHVQSPFLSAFISFAVGTLALFVYLIATGVPLGNLTQARSAPAIAWIGGILGAFFVTAVIVTVPRLGVALTFSLVILGQMMATLPIDHVGFLGMAVKEINFPRIMGVLLIVAGVILIRRF